MGPAVGAALARGLIPDTLHVAGFADKPGDLGKGATFDANVGGDGVDQQRLLPIAQRQAPYRAAQSVPRVQSCGQTPQAFVQQFEIDAVGEADATGVAKG